MQKLIGRITVQRVLFALVIITVLLVAYELKYFLSGFLAAVTLYVLCRRPYLNLTEKKKWNKPLAAYFVLLVILGTMVIPIWLIVEFLIPEINNIIENRQLVVDKYVEIRQFLEAQEWFQRFGPNLDDENLMVLMNRVIAQIPNTLGTISQVLANIATALFILYFMLTRARSMERAFLDLLPLSARNKAYFVKSNVALIRANAYGVPILAVAQGVIALIGYLIFGVGNAVFLGLLTGVASVVPVLGTMLVYVPVAIYQLATGEVFNGIAMTIYGFVLIGGIDNVLRFTILRKLADIHPLITVFGVIMGLQMFGVMGLVFGPLLLSYPGILLNMYRYERNTAAGGDVAFPDSTPQTVVVMPSAELEGESEPEVNEEKN